MKKLLISLLLISLITMVGVFAEDPAPAPPSALLTLNANVKPVSKIGITNAEASGASYGTEPLVVDVFAKNYSEGVLIGHVHFYSNDPLAITVSMEGANLAQAEEGPGVIPYTLTAADSSSATMKTIKAGYSEDTGLDETIFTKVAGPGIVEETQTLTLTVEGTADDYPAGAYEATITFTITAG